MTKTLLALLVLGAGLVLSACDAPQVVETPTHKKTGMGNSPGAATNRANTENKANK